jgi:hypothetical protein
MKCLPTLGLALLIGCMEQLPEHIELAPSGEAVDFVYEAPSSNSYRVVGEVRGIAQGADAEVAEEAAKNDLRNKAGALGATLVSIDEHLGEPMLLVGKTKVTLLGRAYKPVD